MSKYHLALFLIIILYFATRLYHLTNLPMAWDEAIYIFWSKLIAATNKQWFISLSWGKPPLPIWELVALLKLFPDVNTSLFIGRLNSVLFGALTLLVTYKLGSFVFNSKKVGLTSAFLSIYLPFVFFHDRLSLYDASLVCFLTWGLYFSLQALTLQNALITGLFFGLALFSKTTALLFIGTTIVFIFFKHGFTKRTLFANALILVGSFIFQVPLLFSSGTYSYLNDALYYTPTTAQFLDRPFDYFFRNIGLSIEWIQTYYRLPFYLILLSTPILFLRNFSFKSNKLYLFTLWFMTIIGFCFVARVYFPRYLLFINPIALVITSGVVFTHIQSNIVKFIIFVVIVISQMPLITTLWIKPEVAKISLADRDQFVIKFGSGYSLPPLFKFIDDKLAKGEKITLVVQGYNGIFPEAFLIRYFGNNQIKIITPWKENISTEILDAQKNSNLYFAINEIKTSRHTNILSSLNLKVVATGYRPEGQYNSYLAVLE